jgi:chromosomal replication initiation ATPase DnaA
MSHVTLDATGAERFAFMTRPQRQHLARIIAAVVDATGVTAAEIAGRERPDRIACARQMAMCLVFDATGLPALRVAHAFDRDHATIAHARRSIAARRSRDDAFAALYDRLLSQVKA